MIEDLIERLIVSIDRLTAATTAIPTPTPAARPARASSKAAPVPAAPVASTAPEAPAVTSSVPLPDDNDDEPTGAPSTPPYTPKTGPVHTPDDIRTLGRQLAGAGYQDEFLKVLRLEYGAETVSKLNPAQYDPVFDRLQEILTSKKI